MDRVSSHGNHRYTVVLDGREFRVTDSPTWREVITVYHRSGGGEMHHRLSGGPTYKEVLRRVKDHREAQEGYLAAARIVSENLP